jgi:type IV pilus assembly protein PilW
MKTSTDPDCLSLVSLRKNERGFTLIELLVGMVLSLLTIVAIYQVLAVWDAGRRTVTAGSGVQISSSIGGFELERNLQVAGMGFGAVLPATVGCTVQARNGSLPTPNFTFTFAPIEIITGVAGAPDIVRVLSGSSSYAANVQVLNGSTATSKTLENRVGYNAGDLIVVAGTNTPRDCALFEVTGLSATANTIDHGVANYINYYHSTTVAPLMNPPPGGAVFGGGEVYNLGPQPQRTQWQVNTVTAVLSRSNVLQNATTFDVVEGVINLKAQYGIDGSDGSAPNQRIEESEWTSTTPTANWERVLAVRTALLARSNQLETLQVSPTPSTWAGGSQTFTMVNLDGTTALTTGVNDWRRYRYRVYESVVSLRNMLWGAAI